MSVKALFDLSGKTALITGGSRGLGLQMAEALGEMGAKLAITARKADELAEAKAHLQGLGYEVETFTNDLQKFDSIPGNGGAYGDDDHSQQVFMTTIDLSGDEMKNYDIAGFDVKIAGDRKSVV